MFVEWDRLNVMLCLIEWFEEMKEYGIKVMIVFNNNERRVKFFLELFGILFIYKVRKLMGKVFNRVVCNMELKKEDCVVIGDQLLIDVFGGN